MDFPLIGATGIFPGMLPVWPTGPVNGYGTTKSASAVGYAGPGLTNARGVLPGNRSGNYSSVRIPWRYLGIWPDTA